MANRRNYRESYRRNKQRVNENFNSLNDVEGFENEFNVKRMNNDTYKQRRQVIDIIYSLKREGIELPRIEVRILEQNKHSFLGIGYHKNTIGIKEKMFTEKYEGFLYEVVLHEILHAVYNMKHMESCPLMSSYTDKKPMTKAEAFKRFKSHVQAYS